MNLKIFNGFAEGIHLKSIEAYKLFIVKLLNYGLIPTSVNVNTNCFIAEYRECHDNTEAYCALNNSCKRIRGWICLSYSGSPYTTLASHSIIQTEENEFIDITPSLIPNENKFLPSFLSDSDYDNLIMHLYESYGETTMHIKMPT